MICSTQIDTNCFEYCKTYILFALDVIVIGAAGSVYLFRIEREMLSKQVCN